MGWRAHERRDGGRGKVLYVLHVRWVGDIVVDREMQVQPFQNALLFPRMGIEDVEEHRHGMGCECLKVDERNLLEVAHVQKTFRQGILIGSGPIDMPASTDDEAGDIHPQC